MGYSTEFYGEIDIYPPLNEKEIEYLTKFNETRRMDRKKGPYFVDGTGSLGQGHDKDILDYNRPSEGQPGLWCLWIPQKEGSKITWDGGEKFYSAAEWMEYLIVHFLGDDPIAKKQDSKMSFLQGHVLHGIIEAQGEDRDDHWYLIVENNKVRVADYKKTTPKIEDLNKNLIDNKVEVKEPDSLNKKDIHKDKKSAIKNSL